MCVEPFKAWGAGCDTAALEQKIWRMAAAPAPAHPTHRRLLCIHLCASTSARAGPSVPSASSEGDILMYGQKVHVHGEMAKMIPREDKTPQVRSCEQRSAARAPSHQTPHPFLMRIALPCRLQHAPSNVNYAAVAHEEMDDVVKHPVGGSFFVGAECMIVWAAWHPSDGRRRAAQFPSVPARLLCPPPLTQPPVKLMPGAETGVEQWDKVGGRVPHTLISFGTARARAASPAADAPIQPAGPPPALSRPTVAPIWLPAGQQPQGPPRLSGRAPAAGAWQAGPRPPLDKHAPASFDPALPPLLRPPEHCPC